MRDDEHEIHGVLGARLSQSRCGLRLSPLKHPRTISRKPRVSGTGGRKALRSTRSNTLRRRRAGRHAWRTRCRARGCVDRSRGLLASQRVSWISGAGRGGKYSVCWRSKAHYSCLRPLIQAPRLPIWTVTQRSMFAALPSRMGILSEMFRRQKDTRRSLNPAHPVLAAGPLASWFVEGHEECAYSCGPGSPFEKLIEKDAKLCSSMSGWPI